METNTTITPMENNTTPPKEIWLDKNYKFDNYFHSDLIVRTSDYGTGNQVKYLSEQSVKEMLAEKDREIEILREGEKVLINSIEILSAMVKNK